jgi:hypothetical protein
VLGEYLPIRNDKSNKSMKNKVLFQKTILKVMRISFYQVLIAMICTTIAEAREGVAQNVVNQRLSVQSNNQSVEVFYIN